MLHHLRLAWKIFCYGLGIVIVAALAVQAWYYAHVLWWRSYQPAASAFMEARIVRLREKDPKAKLIHQWMPYERISMQLKRAVSPLIDVCNRLVRYDVGTLVPPDVRLYFRDVYDHVVRINEQLDTLRELLTTALEANLSLIAVQQNEVMKQLAAWAAILAVPTMIAGIYGMNFEFMPEIHWRYGYLFALAVIAGAAGGLWLWFKRAGWL